MLKLTNEMELSINRKNDKRLQILSFVSKCCKMSVMVEKFYFQFGWARSAVHLNYSVYTLHDNFPTIISSSKKTLPKGQ